VRVVRACDAHSRTYREQSSRSSFDSTNARAIATVDAEGGPASLLRDAPAIVNAERHRAIDRRTRARVSRPLSSFVKAKRIAAISVKRQWHGSLFPLCASARVQRARVRARASLGFLGRWPRAREREPAATRWRRRPTSTLCVPEVSAPPGSLAIRVRRGLPSRPSRSTGIRACVRARACARECV